MLTDEKVFGFKELAAWIKQVLGYGPRKTPTLSPTTGNGAIPQFTMKGLAIAVEVCMLILAVWLVYVLI